MLSPQSLQRATLSYARGYRDGYFGKNQNDPTAIDLSKPFASGDYADGYDAGQNDRKWDDHYANRNRTA